jgi:hypothetical protein
MISVVTCIAVAWILRNVGEMCVAGNETSARYKGTADRYLNRPVFAPGFPEVRWTLLGLIFVSQSINGPNFRHFNQGIRVQLILWRLQWGIAHAAQGRPRGT